MPIMQPESCIHERWYHYARLDLNVQAHKRKG